MSSFHFLMISNFFFQLFAGLNAFRFVTGTYERDHKQQCLRHKNQSPGLALDRPPDQDPILIPVPAPAPDLDQESADMGKCPL